VLCKQKAKATICNKVKRTKERKKRNQKKKKAKATKKIIKRKTNNHLESPGAVVVIKYGSRHVHCERHTRRPQWIQK
jgi:hypothetical protein